MILSSTRPARRSGFTLIELLVVIAIVAILAAILFPVFAQAKLAAKKSVDLSNLKQTNLGALMYAADQNDLYPIQTPRDGQGGYNWGWCLDVPWDIRSGQDDLYYEWNRNAWANSVQPYIKSYDLYRAPNQTTVWPASWGDQRAQWVKKPGSSSYAMNGLLEQWSTTAVARPSQLIAFSSPGGGTAFDGGSIAQPYLFCLVGDEPCRYEPTRNGCGTAHNGEISGTWYWPDAGFNLRAAFGNEGNFAYADGSAKFRRMAANVNGKTDFHTDPYTEYDRAGNAALSWYDDSYCHPLLFRPDFEFQDYGSPYEGV